MPIPIPLDSGQWTMEMCPASKSRHPTSHFSPPTIFQTKWQNIILCVCSHHGTFMSKAIVPLSEEPRQERYCVVRKKPHWKQYLIQYEEVISLKVIQKSNTIRIFQ